MQPKNQHNIKSTWVREVIADPSDPSNLLLDIGHELCNSMGWVEGDTLEWINNGDNSWTLRKV